MKIETRNNLEKMLNLLEKFEEGVITLHALVDGLEFYKKELCQDIPTKILFDWDDTWGSMEIILGQTSIGESTISPDRFIKQLRGLILGELEDLKE